MKHRPGPSGSHAAVIREANERAVLTTLRRLGEASKADLSRRVNLTQNTVGLIVKGLEERGLIAPSRRRLGLRGQPARLLRLDPAGAYAIGVKIGRRTQQSVLIDFAGHVLKSRFRECVHPMPEDALSFALGDIETLTAAIPHGHIQRLCGVGLATPYNPGNWRRELGLPAAVHSAWQTFDIAAAIEARIDVSTFVENDGTAAALAELFNGHGTNLDDFATIFIGSAIGGGLVLEGSYRSGVSRNAADIGLMPVAPSRLASAPAPAGLSDILLNRASAGTLMRHLRAGGVPIHLTSQIEEAAALRPDLVDEWIDDCVDALVAPLFTMSSLLDLQAVIVDGLLPRPLIERLVERTGAAMAAAAPEGRDAPRLLVGRIGRDAAAIGAATLPFYFNFATDRASGPAAQADLISQAGVIAQALGASP